MEVKAGYKQTDVATLKKPFPYQSFTDQPLENDMIEQDREYPTKLTNDQYERCWKVARAFLSKNNTLRNKQLREIAGVGYDQAIGFFNRAVIEKRLLRKGVGSGTHYVLKD